MIKQINKKLKLDFHPASFIIGGTWDDEWANDLMERETFDHIFKTLDKHPNPVLVDIGANIGMYSFINKEKGFKIYSFEPNPVAFLCLQENLKLNQTNTEIFNVACGENNYDLYLTPEDVTWKAGLISMTDTKTFMPTKVVKVDDYVKEKVTHVKIDIEGYEPLALQGMDRILKEDGPILFLEIMEENLAAYQWTKQGLIDLLDGYGYQMVKELKGYNFVFEKSK